MQQKLPTNIGTCRCGRSPTGDCIGWHALSEDVYQYKKMLWWEEEFRRDSETQFKDLKNDS